MVPSLPLLQNLLDLEAAEDSPYVSIRQAIVVIVQIKY
jgi:hypothetical protein